MTSKKSHPAGIKEEQTSPEKPQPETEATSRESTKPIVEAESQESLQMQLDQAQSLAADYKDGWQRSVAEFQNYRRRVESEKAETYQMAVSNIVKRYLPVVDDMERAIDSRPAGLPWTDGIELIYRKLQSILEAEGLVRMDVVGKKFDPNFHEAISEEPAEGLESGTILSVIRNGYMLGDHVVRPAMVRVAK